MKIVAALMLIIASTGCVRGQIFLHNLLDETGPGHTHQVFTDSERRFFNLTDGRDAWIIPCGGDDYILDTQSLLALFANDFFEFYRDSGIDFSTPLKRKRFESSTEYEPMKAEMASLRNMVVDDTLHMPMQGVFDYTHEYDVDNGRFQFALNTGNLTLHIPDHLNKHFMKDGAYRFYLPISNLDIAVEIEDPHDTPPACNFLVRFRYRDNPPREETVYRDKKSRPKMTPRRIYDRNEPPYFELTDIILYKVATGQIVWSLTLGDLSAAISGVSALFAPGRVEGQNSVGDEAAIDSNHSVNG